jgi:hypothetical protein
VIIAVLVGAATSGVLSEIASTGTETLKIEYVTLRRESPFLNRKSH